MLLEGAFSLLCRVVLNSDVFAAYMRILFKRKDKRNGLSNKEDGMFLFVCCRAF